MCLVMFFFFFFPSPLVASEGAFQNHSRLRTPPLPLSHSHSPSHQHHAASINSLNRGNYTPRSNPSPAPTDSSAPPEGPASGQDSGSAQDNWLLNSNIPLETRYCANLLVLLLYLHLPPGVQNVCLLLKPRSANEKQSNTMENCPRAKAYNCHEHGFCCKQEKSSILILILCEQLRF